MRPLAAPMLFLGLLAVPAARAAETGNVCIHHFSPGISCDGGELRITRLALMTLLESCAAGDPNSAEATFRVWISGTGVTGYDAGLFLSLNGQSAISGGQCLHDYLEPPLNTSPTFGDVDGNGRPDLVDGNWYDGEPFAQPQDTCGDIPAGTDAVKTLTFRFACADNDGDGIVDLHACASWHQGTNSRCDGLADAFPPTSMRCRCDFLETGIPLLGGPQPAGSITGLLAQRVSSQVQLSWPPSCAVTDTDYGVYEGALGQWASHQRVLCTTGGSTSATVLPGAGNRYFLVVPRNALVEGSYGKSTAGLERAPATDACADQAVRSPCP
ncbi:MAG TPA: hypothetical protein VFV75_06415 [Candidatus Polarisedimenticolaceae bacterium]|nr:hypothetical protein [Candidatus Polarisedimenticolaceae bacterium]